MKLKMALPALATVLVATTAIGSGLAAEVNLMGYDARFEENYKKAVIEPFEQETGIKVNYSPAGTSAEQIGILRAQKGNPTVDLSIMEHHFAGTQPLDVQREYGIAPRIRTQYCGQFAQRRGCRDRFACAAINRYRNQTLSARSPSIVFTATGALRGGGRFPGLPRQPPEDS